MKKTPKKRTLYVQRAGRGTRLPTSPELGWPTPASVTIRDLRQHLANQSALLSEVRCELIDAKARIKTQLDELERLRRIPSDYEQLQIERTKLLADNARLEGQLAVGPIPAPAPATVDALAALLRSGSKVHITVLPQGHK